jgi:orotate phosphoribosyltransferase
MPVIEAQTTRYGDVQAELAENFLAELKRRRQQFRGQPVEPEGTEEVDRLFAAQMATRLLEVSLRPSAVHDSNEVRGLISPCGDGKFLTSITLDDLAMMIAETGALLRGHFVLLGGGHSEYFFMFSRLGTRVEFRKKLASELAKRFSSLGVQSVVAPVTAGGLLVQDVAAELRAGFAFYDVDNHSRPSGLRRGYSVSGKTLIVNDMTTSGRGVEQMLKILRDQGVEPVGLGLLATRGSEGARIAADQRQTGLKVEVLFHLNVEAVSEASCATCRTGIPPVRSEDINR